MVASPFKLFIATMAVGAAVVPALPTSDATARGLLPSVYYCKDKGFVSCFESGVVNGQCSAVSSNYIGTVSSFRMDAGLRCTIYTDTGCTQGAASLTKTSYSDLTSVGMNDKVSSFSCV